MIVETLENENEVQGQKNSSYIFFLSDKIRVLLAWGINKKS